MGKDRSYQPVSMVLEGTNETFKGFINMTVQGDDADQKPYDETGAAYYVIAVVLVYGLSMVLLIGSLAKKNMKDNSLDHDDRQVSQYLERVPSLKEMSAREKYKELKSNIITLVSSKTPPGDLSGTDRDCLMSSNGSDMKKVSFSIENEQYERPSRHPRIYIGSDNLGDTSASENSPLLGQGSPQTSPLVGYNVTNYKSDSDGLTLDSDSETDTPILKPKFKYRSTWGETRIYHKSYMKKKRPGYVVDYNNEKEYMQSNEVPRRNATHIKPGPTTRSNPRLNGQSNPWLAPVDTEPRESSSSSRGSPNINRNITSASPVLSRASERLQRDKSPNTSRRLMETATSSRNDYRIPNNSDVLRTNAYRSTSHKFQHEDAINVRGLNGDNRPPFSQNHYFDYVGHSRNFERGMPNEKSSYTQSENVKQLTTTTALVHEGDRTINRCIYCAKEHPNYLMCSGGLTENDPICHSDEELCNNNTDEDSIHVTTV